MILQLAAFASLLLLGSALMGIGSSLACDPEEGAPAWRAPLGVAMFLSGATIFFAIVWSVA